MMFRMAPGVYLRETYNSSLTGTCSEKHAYSILFLHQPLCQVARPGLGSPPLLQAPILWPGAGPVASSSSTSPRASWLDRANPVKA